ncbi:glycosyltransferase [Bradyrhizobium lablabi]|uniref:Glycosyltransferase involved in cell wall bisynthesis n=3 Tax=Bradyrhizobium TaxID=374 RepID=A0ABY0Q913_9BRAD|nr:glycosyltransferase [Bradyrhizobium lablabi]SDJ71688.1 Glycosyltransferase involved in cell wall bisynthesis [Bradyrhizobium ottawaense]SEC21708.1 Glycosyltransferase involved in cell wall bisynthesis [Bradyrhizobium lablabi]
MNLVSVEANRGPDQRKTLAPLQVAIVTTAAPPSANGQARVLGQIVAPTMFAPPMFLTDQMNIVELDQAHYGSHFELSPPRFQLTTRKWGKLAGRFNHSGGLLRSVMVRAGEITRILHDGAVDVVVGCSGNPFDLPASFLAARRLRIPFVAYLFDDPVYQWERGIYRNIARVSEQIWSRGALRLIAPNEVLASDIRKRLPRADIHIVRNPAAVALNESPAKRPDANPARWRLLYTGSVYSAQASAFRNLVAALGALGGRFAIDIYTGQHGSELVTNELASPHVDVHPQAPHATAVALQQAADVLFLPLAFYSPIPEVIRSSAPAKLGEYLASGRPILVHAPAGSFITELIRNADAGLVVDTPDPRKLAEALNRIADDEVLRSRIVANALVLARQFSVERARADFGATIASVVRH